ncbi:beta-galactosidase [Frondihabitans sp. PAMC 28766]|uniref:glycoside hydrolase family 2 protein n=1 Tax=Frondihabitans sp. PAMC 28766 TaxID=1795630 RepID=UPI00078C90ED|nr:sugar-binding domain-containing protein [Frondihabitans sp. PAMC 28766]AMM20670.1 beta-galactosidase [Frondihabitans sp. PAMC 28766]
MTDSTATPRADYPRPQFTRERWLNLNGQWGFEFDPGDSGLERGLLQGDRELQRQITVPFAPESELSGIGDVDFHPAVWYRRSVTVPADWADDRILVHFGAVDHDTTVWMLAEGQEAQEVGRHRGGFTSFTFDLTARAGVEAGDTIDLIVRARDSKDAPQARGKQSTEYANHDADYTRTTGIWQTVWLEPVPTVAILRPRITPDLESGTFTVEVPIGAGHANGLRGGRVRVTVSDDEGEIESQDARADLTLTPRLTIEIPDARVRPWSIGDPYLYGLRIELLSAHGDVVDTVGSYAGLRSIAIDGQAILINGERVFQRLVLDQGLYSDGLLTAPSDADLVRDIELSMRAGFNGARLHQKVFEERFLYHADRLGYLVWGEFGDWGAKTTGPSDDRQQPDASFVAEWLEALERDYSHPAIVGWCPLNETRQHLSDRITVLDDVTRAMFLATKAMDTTRPVLDASGYAHRVYETDVYDNHSYDQDPVSFGATMDLLDPVARTAYISTEDDDGMPRPDLRQWSLPYNAQPYFCSEFGGIWWNAAVASAVASAAADAPAQSGTTSWGYGERVHTIEEFYERFEGLVTALLDNEHMFGYCYTQLTAVFQEQNGVYDFDRSDKFDIERIAAVQRRPAAIEVAARSSAAV